MDLEITHKVALVTGASRGLGRAICEILAAEGAHLIINCLDSESELEAADKLAERLRAKHNTQSLVVPADIADPEQVNRLFKTALKEFETIDILINNAAIWLKDYVADMPVEQWNQTMAVNLRGPFLTCQQAVNHWLEKNKTGAIVNISSQAAFHGSTTGHAHYAASKAGLITFTKSLAREVAAQGIRVNALAPGFMETDMMKQVPTEKRQQCLERIPLGRIADPREMANAVAFLASAQASYVTGATFDVNGGMLMR